MTATRMHTPNLVGLFKDEVAEEMALHEKHLGDNWDNVENHPCPKCNGTGINPEFPEDGFCHACDGTGIHYTLYYGVKDGGYYAYADEYGVDFIKEYCKAMREAFEQSKLAGKVPDACIPYVIPKVIEFELIARGFHPEDFYSGSNIRKIANIMSREYPDFLCVPYYNF